MLYDPNKGPPIIISLLIITIIAYCIFAYPFVFNKVDTIQYNIKMAEIKAYYTEKWNKLVYFNINKLNDFILNKFSNIKKRMDSFITDLRKRQQFINNLYYDFFIFV